MKRLTLILCLLCAPFPALFTSCSQAPSERVVFVQTLKSIGQTAETTVAVSARLYQAGDISPAQAHSVAVFYDQVFQKAFKTAVFAAKSNLDTVASPDLVALAQQLSSMVSSFTEKREPTSAPHK